MKHGKNNHNYMFCSPELANHNLAFAQPINYKSLILTITAYEGQYTFLNWLPWFQAATGFHSFHCAIKRIHLVYFTFGYICIGNAAVKTLPWWCVQVIMENPALKSWEFLSAWLVIWMLFGSWILNLRWSSLNKPRVFKTFPPSNCCLVSSIWSILSLY